nr:TetR/AcrR family transcriptional regulator [Saccharopolyspora sp. HNM0983]
MTAGGPDDPVSGDLLDVARAEFERAGIRAATVHGIARRAGIGRATVYRRYPDKRSLVDAVVLREVRDFLRHVDERISHIAEPAAQMAECFAVVLTGLREHSLLNGLLGVEPEETLPALTIHAGAALALARGYVADLLRGHQAAEKLADFDVQPLAEIFVRLVHSAVLTPSGWMPEDEGTARTFAHAHLTPLLGETPARRPR